MIAGATTDGDVGGGRSSRRALLVALGVDDLGSGLFLPLAVVYITAVVGIPLASAGLLITAGTLVGLLAPPLAGGLVDRVGPRPVVVASQVLQAAGVLVYLVATGPVAVLIAAALVAAGTQTFYSAVFALVADVAPAGPKDRTFAVVGMVRSACFGIGALVAAALVAAVDVSVLRTALALDAVSFVVAGGLLVLFVRPRHHTVPPPDAAPPPLATPSPPVPVPRSVLRNRPYLALMLVTTLLGLPTDFVLVGLAVYLRELAPGSEWAAGATITALTATSLLAVVALRLTARWRRTTSLAVGGWCTAAWAGLTVVTVWLPAGWAGAWVLGSAVVLAAGSLLFGTRVNALAEAAAPAASRGQHLAAFQYSFTAANLLAPLLVSSMALGLWVPWLVVGAAALLGAVAAPVVGRRLPASASGNGA